jgi:hypothetical protein
MQCGCMIVLSFHDTLTLLPYDISLRPDWIQWGAQGQLQDLKRTHADLLQAISKETYKDGPIETLDGGVTLSEGDLGVKLKRALDMPKPCPHESFTGQQQVAYPTCFSLIFYARQTITMGGCKQDYMWLAKSISILWILVLLTKNLKCKSSVFCMHFPQPYRLHVFIDNVKKSYRDPFIFAMRLDDSLRAYY